LTCQFSGRTAAPFFRWMGSTVIMKGTPVLGVGGMNFNVGCRREI